MQHRFSKLTLSAKMPGLELCRWCFVSGLLLHCSSSEPAPGEPAALGGSGGEILGSAGETPAPVAPPPDPVPPPAVDVPDNTEGNPIVGGVAGSASEPPPASGAGGTAQEPPPDVPAFAGGFILGADISSIQEAVDNGAVYVDTDGQEKSALDLFKNHGFNYVRLRTFVEPLAEYGYASASDCPGKAEAYADAAHTVEFAREIKAAGMGFLLDFHYSDTWADPGKQVIPEDWRDLGSIQQLAAQVGTYTEEVLTALVAAGATPDMVQVGNEITPGMLIHVPTNDTDCYGSGSAFNQALNGSQNNWDNLALLLEAGIEATRRVTPNAKVMLHIENTGNPNGVINWVENALSRGVEFDVLGLSAYEAFQGPASAWRATLNQLATRFPELSFAIAEYNPSRRLLNDIMRELPDGRGVGTFFWEPTQSGSWGTSMFNRQGNRFSANPADFAEYDQLRTDFGL